MWNSTNIIEIRRIMNKLTTEQAIAKGEANKHEITVILLQRKYFIPLQLNL